jgi:flagellar hook-associated protein 2
MSSFTVGGLSTGVDYNELITKLIEVKRQPINLLVDKKDSYNQKISSYSDLSSKLSALKEAVKKLKTTTDFYAKNASVSDETVLDVSVGGSTSEGNYTVAVTTLASEEKEVHNGTGLTSSSDVVNNSGGDRIFQYTYGGTQVSITVTDGTTLETLKTLINDDVNNPGVAATVVNDGTNYRLILTGNETGETNTITIDAGTTLDGTGGTSDFTAASFAENKTASNADFTVDNLQISRSSNSIGDVIQGMTINLKKDGGASSTITVTADTDAIKTQIEDFVSAYNDVVDFISTQTDYDSATGVSGILSGEGTARGIRERLRSMISGSVSELTGDISMLAQMGINTNSKTGQLEFNSTTFESKLASDLDDIAEFFTYSSSGLADQVYDYIGEITSTVDGSITLREKGLKDMIENIDGTIRNMEYRLERTEDDLVRKFTSLELLVSGYNTTGDFLASSINLFA